MLSFNLKLDQRRKMCPLACQEGPSQGHPLFWEKAKIADAVESFLPPPLSPIANTHFGWTCCWGCYTSLKAKKTDKVKFSGCNCCICAKHIYTLGSHLNRDLRVGVSNFGTDRVRVRIGFGYWHCIFINRVLSGIENIDWVTQSIFSMI